VETLRLEEKRGKISATIVTRKTLPACFLEGYSLRWIVYGFENLPMEQYETALPGLAPGEQLTLALAFQEKKPRRIRVDIIRPTGFSSLTAHWKA
jgi:beta-galactosidase